MESIKFAVRAVLAGLQALSLILFGLLALALSVATGLALFGVLPWVTLPLAWNGAAIPAAGTYAQAGLTVIALALCVFLPSNWRILRLEHSHRSFALGIDDITRAYHAAHAADRAGIFNTHDAFEDMHDRLKHLRDHPDLGVLEPELLELAAKMSHVSRDLAEAYSDTRIARARSFLKERQFEIERFNDRLAHARAIHSEFANWIQRVDLDERVARTQMERLVDELERMLPELTRPAERTTRPTGVVADLAGGLVATIPQGGGTVTQLTKRVE